MNTNCAEALSHFSRVLNYVNAGHRMSAYHVEFFITEVKAVIIGYVTKEVKSSETKL